MEEGSLWGKKILIRFNSEFIWGFKVTGVIAIMHVLLWDYLVQCISITVACTFFTSALYLALHWLKFIFQCQAKVIYLTSSWGRTLSLNLTYFEEWASTLTSFFLIVYHKVIYVLLLVARKWQKQKVSQDPLIFPNLFQNSYILQHYYNYRCQKI